MTINNYWSNYWKEKKIESSENLQSQVSRIRQGEPITDRNWIATLNYIIKKMELDRGNPQFILDACGGNGLFATEFAKLGHKVTIVDINLDLVSNCNLYKNIFIVNEDLIKYLQNCDETYDLIFLYAGIQYFTNEQTTKLFSLMSNLLNPNGIVFIGDIPDLQKRDRFLKNNNMFQKHFDLLADNVPHLGNWFTKEWLNELATYSGFQTFKVMKQPKYQIYSDFRFDVLLKLNNKI